jgi:cytochrome c oxidase subunit 2
VGEFTGQCAEFCGVQHGRMGSLVVVQPPDEFNRWVERQRTGSPLINAGVVQAPAPADTAAAASDTAAAGAADTDSVEIKGRQAFLAGGCIGCHAMVGTPTAGVLTLQGPNLSHFGSRRRIAAGMLPNTPENLAAWLRDPQAIKEGSLMKLPRQLTEDEISTLVAYLRAHQ